LTTRKHLETLGMPDSLIRWSNHTPAPHGTGHGG
jgi:hypothetical protein